MWTCARYEFRLIGMSLRAAGQARAALSFAPPATKQRLELERRAPAGSHGFPPDTDDRRCCLCTAGYGGETKPGGALCSEIIRPARKPDRN